MFFFKISLKNSKKYTQNTFHKFIQINMYNYAVKNFTTGDGFKLNERKISLYGLKQICCAYHFLWCSYIKFITLIRVIMIFFSMKNAYLQCIKNCIYIHILEILFSSERYKASVHKYFSE